MKQNIYDDHAFFEKYSGMERSMRGLDGAEEWPVFRTLLPDLAGKRVLDLGCGFGWHCRHAREQGASYVLGIDLSARMLARARAATAGSGIEYRQCAIEDFRCDEASFDVAISSLAFHYVERFDDVCRNIRRVLTDAGFFAFSVEHPIFTSRAEQEWHVNASGQRLHWPIDDYHDEGVRHTRWMADDVVKYHRTVQTYVNTVVDCGFRIEKLLEPGISPERAVERPDLKDERRRPMFLVVAARVSPDSGTPPISSSARG